LEDLNGKSFDQGVWFSTFGDGRKTNGQGIHWTGYRTNKELIGCRPNWTSAKEHIAVVFKRY